MPSSAMPSNKLAISLAGTAAPRHFPYPVWFENATVLSDQVSKPRRCSGNKAAVLPTLPQATQDWMESTVDISMRLIIHTVEDSLDVEKNDHPTGDEQRKTRRVHGAALPGMGDKQTGEPDDGE